jgi:hypothetical protein
MLMKNRALPTVLLAALAGAVGTGTAHAASGAAPSPRSGHELTGATSVPARGPGALASGRKANAHSTNWAGYAVTGGTYTSVASNWVEPYVTCTSTGIVGFWIGLDGWGSRTVEQDGTGVDCSNGSPRQFAWWETYPTNSIQVYDAPVAAGDRMSSSVVSQGGGHYVMVLTDWTQNWTERNAVNAPTARNASAEIVAEAVTTGSSITALPDFGALAFTGSTINGGTLQSAAAQPIDMTDQSNNLIATTTAADPYGDFNVSYVGGATSGAARSSSTSSGTSPSTSSNTSGNSAAAAGSGSAADGQAAQNSALFSRVRSLLARP